MGKKAATLHQKFSQSHSKDQNIENGAAACMAANELRPVSASLSTRLPDRPLRKDRKYSLDDVAFALETSQESGIPFTRIVNEITAERSRASS